MEFRTIERCSGCLFAYSLRFTLISRVACTRDADFVCAYDHPAIVFSLAYVGTALTPTATTLLHVQAGKLSIYDRMFDYGIIALGMTGSILGTMDALDRIFAASTDDAA